MTDPRIAAVLHARIAALVSEYRYDNITDEDMATRILASLDALAPKAEERESLRSAVFLRYEERCRNDGSTWAPFIDARQLDALIDVLDERLKGGG